MKDNSRNYILNKTKNILKNILFWLGFLALAMSLFNIQIFESKSETVSWNDIIFILDTSTSMNVEDISYNSNKISRLNFGKVLIKNLISSNPNNSYWLIAFAGKANIISPITTEFNTFINFLDNLNSKTISSPWTNFLEALKLWIWTVWKNSIKNFVVMSDGWETEDKIDRLGIKSLINSRKIKIFSVWVWTKEWGKIPIWTDFFWNDVYKSYNDQFVISKLYEKNLVDIKDLWAGKYIKASAVDSLNNVKSDFINSVNVKKINKDNESQRYLVIISGVLLLIWYLIPNKERKWIN
ncbi:MAG: von Willebrand factor (vWA) type A protein [uncultured bacterium (gcode 4)]|uniref:von Willebrand factor (VWA) type A protein n=1 Tax=uncultured bacterium (gcode 4) TaxID=1234023 RepID=K2AX22_9BACT|nr:MAG: von Willebrand factor (vWA) type A protein [uncultured bacterium (gcode 4)]